MLIVVAIDCMYCTTGRKVEVLVNCFENTILVIIVASGKKGTRRHFLVGAVRKASESILEVKLNYSTDSKLSMEATLPPGTYGALVHSKVFVKREI